MREHRNLGSANFVLMTRQAALRLRLMFGVAGNRELHPLVQSAQLRGFVTSGTPLTIAGILQNLSVLGGQITRLHDLVAPRGTEREQRQAQRRRATPHNKGASLATETGNG